MAESTQRSRSGVNSKAEQFAVLGLPLHLVDDYSAWLLRQLQQGQGVHVVTLNAEMAIQAEQNPALAAVIRRAELVIPDGAGVVLYLRLRGKKTQRCPGIELAEQLIRSTANRSGTAPYSVFFYGGAPGVTQTAAEVWQQRVPGLAIAGVEHGFLSEAEQQALDERLNTLQPNVICVGLGVPRQEFWIADHRHLCPNAIWIGVGGSFDIWAGVKTRAPRWLRNNNLEWVYRLYQEPWRWRRMTALPKFAWKALTYWGRA
jgi:N-acetylglucosaminyldiphosphoundecaprenol N-acetyl-beta-D-mannosaminyltransferase